MARILILYSSFDGQTARVARRVASVLEHEGHAVDVRPADPHDAAAQIGSHDAVIIGAAIRFGHHAKAVHEIAGECREALAARPNAFFQVCLTAGGPGARPEAALRYLQQFCQKTGWHPRETAIFAGALQYTKYNLFIRSMIRLIMTITHGETDTSRDYEYTDWHAVERFAAAFAARLKLPAAA